MKDKHIARRDGVDQDGDPIWRCIHCGGWSGGRSGLLSTTCYAARKVRIGDEVARLGKPDRVGKVWELRASGFASVHWNDERPSIHASDPASYNVKHYKLENLRHAR